MQVLRALRGWNAKAAIIIAAVLSFPGSQSAADPPKSDPAPIRTENGLARDESATMAPDDDDDPAVLADSSNNSSITKTQVVTIPAATGYTSPPTAPGQKAAVQPWKLLFFDNDFSYKKKPDHQRLFGEELKDIPLDDLPLLTFLPDESFVFSTGGEVRFREMDESNRLRPGPPARGDYQLWRWRQYADLKVGDWFRIYGEMIDASMDNNPLATTGIDVNRWDVQNLLFDLRVWEFDNGRPVWFRAGRQELSYGSQRLVSPLDWANTRRNFEGLKFFTKGSDWDFDLWFTRPVNSATIGDTPVTYAANHFDSPNMNHTFSGAWFTYKGVKEQIVDLYWLWDFNSKLIQPGFPGGNRHTVAGRWLRNFPVLEGDRPIRTWHGEVEGGYQFGEDFGKNVVAGFVTAGAGHTWNTIPWTPNLWIYYDYASGSNNLNGGTTHTFNQQYGLTHAYLGQIDNVARQNIGDINGKFTVKPHPQLVLDTQYHWLDLANSHDVLYTITGQPFGKPNRGSHVGDELDLVGTYTVNPNFSVQLGYFWFWYGDVVQNNSPRGTAEQLYVMTTFRY